MLRGESWKNGGPGFGMNLVREFWRFVMVQQYCGKLTMKAIDHPPTLASATFNLDAVKAKIDAMMKQHESE